MPSKKHSYIGNILFFITLFLVFLYFSNRASLDIGPKNSPHQTDSLCPSTSSSTSSSSSVSPFSNSSTASSCSLYSFAAEIPDKKSPYQYKTLKPWQVEGIKSAMEDSDPRVWMLAWNKVIRQTVGIIKSKKGQWKPGDRALLGRLLHHLETERKTKYCREIAEIINSI